MAPTITQAFQHMSSRWNMTRHLHDFHARCNVHLVKLSVKGYLQIIHPKIELVRGPLSPIRLSVKRCDMYQIVKNALGVSHEILGLDVSTRWLSTFNMIEKAYDARRILDTFTRIWLQLHELAISNDTWDIVAFICKFLQYKQTLPSVSEVTHMSHSVSVWKLSIQYIKSAWKSKEMITFWGQFAANWLKN